MSTMKKTLFILILVFHTFGKATVFSQIDRIECLELTDLRPLKPEVKKSIIEDIHRYINQIESEHKEGEIVSLYCPPTELYFDKDCEFPIKYKEIYFSLALLLVKPNSKLLLEPHNDRISYKENAAFNIDRAETVKKIFMYFGIDADRISINDMKDQRPMATNKTEEGRKHNRYVRMSITW